MLDRIREQLVNARPNIDELTKQAASPRNSVSGRTLLVRLTGRYPT
jgi:hypothetical protein